MPAHFASTATARQSLESRSRTAEAVAKLGFARRYRNELERLDDVRPNTYMPCKIYDAALRHFADTAKEQVHVDVTLGDAVALN